MLSAGVAAASLDSGGPCGRRPAARMLVALSCLSDAVPSIQYLKFMLWS